VGRPGEPGEPLYYREEIYHPALTEPLIARGHFELRRDGSLVRHQSEPEVETVRIGEDFVFIRRESEGGESNILPIPSDLEFLFTSLRAIIGQAGPEVLSSYSLQLETGVFGWRLALSPGGRESSADRLVVEGCGDRVYAVDLEFQDGNRRRITFEAGS
jgi:hypothetical protein